MKRKELVRYLEIRGCRLLWHGGRHDIYINPENSLKQPIARHSEIDDNFNDTDTALVEFSDNTVQETREISENIYIDIDADGNLVSMTIEHAGTTAHLPDISYQQIGNTVAA